MGKKAKPASGTGAALSEDAQEFASRAEALRQSGDALFAQGKCVVSRDRQRGRQRAGWCTCTAAEPVARVRE
jgi:hypothetical protein